MRKRDMKTECYDAKDRPSEYYHEYSCIDCCTLVSTLYKTEDAIKDIVEAWSSKSLNSEKLSSLYKERSEVSSKYRAQGIAVGEAACNVLDTSKYVMTADVGSCSKFWKTLLDILALSSRHITLVTQLAALNTLLEARPVDHGYTNHKETPLYTPFGTQRCL